MVGVVAVVTLAAVWLWPRDGWRDDPAAGARDVRLQCRAGHDDPYLVRVTVTNHTGQRLDYRIDGDDDESTTADHPATHTYPFHTEVDGVPAGGSRTVDVSGPSPTGYVVGSRCRWTQVHTRQ